MPKIQLIEDLTTGPIPAGSNLLIEYDPASQWYNASVTIAAGWLRSGGKLTYNVAAQPPENLRSQFRRLGLDTATLEKEGKMQIFDYYTATLGQKSKENERGYDSLKIADLSIIWSRGTMQEPPAPEWLRIWDNVSMLARFNEDKAWTEFLLSRVIASSPIIKTIRILGLIGGVHSSWVYKVLEAAVDGIADFKLEDTNAERRELFGIRSMRNVGFDRRWHEVRTRENFEVTLEK